MSPRNVFASVLALGALGLAACAPTDDPTSSSESASTADDYAFHLPSPGERLERIDAMGVALTSTVLMNRDKDNANRYQIASPDVHKDPHTLLSFVKMLRGLHSYWHDQLASLGFEPCSPKLPIIGVPVLGLSVDCTLQRFRFDEDKNELGPRTIDVVIPDYITLDIDEPLRFPNGRTPWESISDKILSMGFLKQGGKCPGLDRTAGVSDAVKKRVPRDDDERYSVTLADGTTLKGQPICTIETFTDIGLQVQQNDRPFKKGTFPYLAEPWFYEANGPTYFWPWTSTSDKKRMEKPE